ncbi:putative glucan endo-1,3-beta-glucosidase A6 [Iris pallida]|uniref:glucan endo-1,3-beta-D-glucosidase n=1 Tax=Iris pallida TaxID=29817 RepID=A0AAX6FHR6_IRIPA|nr:putative glucan endo-1,3-beta-glucosidase A6 [Iris pallida]
MTSLLHHFQLNPNPYHTMSLLLLLFLIFSFSIYRTNGTYFRSLGVNFGTLGNDLPSSSVSVSRIRHLRAGGVKIYDANPDTLRALSGVRIPVAIMLPNQLISAVSSNQSAADSWLASSLLPFYPKTRIRFLLVGNEVLSDPSTKATWPHIVPAMTRLHASLRSHSITKVKVGTTLAMDTVRNTSITPPSAAEFRPDIAGPVMKPLLDFLNRTRSYYFVDAYPYFPWASDPTRISLDYCLFRGNSSTNYLDPVSKLTYTNLLDQQLDSVVFAMERLGFASVKLAVAETGWPNGGDYDQIGANIHNAATYNRNLAKRMRARPPLGTPARPGTYIPVFVFALYNENMKGGPGTERHWGLLYPNGTRMYDVDLTGERTEYAPLPLPTNNEPHRGKIWCVLGNLTADATAVGDAVSYACGAGKGTCDEIQQGRDCYEPNNLIAHANYAFNSYWQQFRSSGGTCYFNGLAVQTLKDPSHGSCKFVAN